MMQYFTTADQAAGGYQTTFLSAGTMTQVFCLGPITMNKNDVVWASANSEITNNGDGNNMSQWELFLSTDPAAIESYDPKLKFSGWDATNITPDQHHFSISNSGCVRCNSAGQWYVIFAAAADADYNMTETSETGGYGKMDALVFSRDMFGL
jgi:hypothetical protein